MCLFASSSSGDDDASRKRIERESKIRREEAGDDASWKRESKRRRRRRETEVVEVPNDDVLEIMVRLPVESLLRFKNVSKHWRHTINSRYFMKKYMSHQKTKEPKFICLYEGVDQSMPNITIKTMRLEWSLTRLVEEEEYLTSNKHRERTMLFSKSLDGLFCLYSGVDMTEPIEVINPDTRWTHKLPLSRIQQKHYVDKNIKVDSSRLGFGKDYVTETYKLVWLHTIKHTSLLHEGQERSNKNTTTSCEVFEFGAKKWRRVTPPPHHHRIKLEHAPAFANGWLYWLSKEKTKLVAFDLHLEVFRIVPNPIIDASSSSSVDMFMESVDDDRPLVLISETNGDGIQHVWRLTNHNTGGTLSIMDKMFSFDLNKITSTWFDSHYSSLLKLMALSKKTGDKMLSRPCSKSRPLSESLNCTLIHNCIFPYSRPPRRIHSSLLPYFPSFSCPL